MPEQDLAIAITSCIENMQAILTVLWDELIPALEDEPLPENPAGNKQVTNVTMNQHKCPPLKIRQRNGVRFGRPISDSEKMQLVMGDNPSYPWKLRKR